ncbi:MAG: hypothetical protein ACFFC6_11375 [Promethearchaeota archaeon]
MRPKTEYQLAEGIDFLLYDILQVLKKIAEKQGVELERKSEQPPLKVVEDKQTKKFTCKHCGKRWDTKIELMACARKDKKEGAYK